MVVINDKKYYDPAPPYPDAQVVRVAGLVSARGGFGTTSVHVFRNGFVPSPCPHSGRVHRDLQRQRDQVDANPKPNAQQHETAADHHGTHRLKN